MKKIKIFIYPLLYWIVFCLLLFMVAPIVIRDGGWILVYLIIFPLLFIIPYKLAKPKNKKEKFLFILFGFIIPFVLLYYYLWLDFQKNFHPGF